MHRKQVYRRLRNNDLRGQMYTINVKTSVRKKATCVFRTKDRINY